MQTKKLKEWFNEIILGETIFRKLKDYKLEDRGKEIDTKLKLSKREFRGKGQYIDELFK